MKKVILFLLALSLLLTACGAAPSTEPESAPPPNPTPIISTVSPADCYICGDGMKDVRNWGQNNIGIISLNTFNVLPLELNRYDIHGTLIEQHGGYMQKGGFQAPKNGFSAELMISPDSGYATGHLSFHDDEVLDVEKTATFLCQHCLDSMLSEIHEQGFGVGVINFATKELYAFEKNYTGFGLGDYYVHICGWKARNETEDTQEMDFLVFYQPPRYEESN